MPLPRLVKMTQTLVTAPLPSPADALDAALETCPLEGRVPPGRVAIAVGSRNIDGLVPVLERLVLRLRERGCRPFVLAAMGSHGGATVAGQQRVLESLGVTIAAVGAPVETTVDGIELGVTASGAVAYATRPALEADAVVLVNRVAAHTGYAGPVQSGLLKMAAVGLGGPTGARALHQHGFESPHLIGEVAEMVIERTSVALGVAMVEDGCRRLSRLEVIPVEDMLEREPALLQAAVDMHPCIPLSSADLLVVEAMGKDVSGVGMDPLVTGRGKESEPTCAGFDARRVVVLSLTPGSQGNATGVGLADVTTERLVNCIDRVVTYRNVLTSGALHRARTPIVAADDRKAIEMALESLGSLDTAQVRAIVIRNTRQLTEFLASEALVDELSAVPGVEKQGEPADMSFDAHGCFVWP